MKKWRIIEDKNIADVLIEIYGRNRRELLNNVVLAFSSVMVSNIKEMNTTKIQNIEIEGKSFEEKIFNFIEKLIYLKDTKGLIFKSGQFAFKKGKIIADLFGEKISLSLPIKTDIKALTHHKFKLKKNHYWLLIVVFDV